MKISLRKDKIMNEENKEFTVYGIDVVDQNGTKSFKDIFFDREKAEEFAEFCRRNALSAEAVEIFVHSLFG